MKKLLLVLLFAVPVFGATLDKVVLVQRTYPTLWKVEELEAFGTGVVISPGGLLLTCAHVVRGESSIVIRTYRDKTFTAKVLKKDPITDLALLQIQGVHSPLPYVHIGVEDVKLGDDVWAYGFPHGKPWIVTKGEVVGLLQDMGVPVLLHSARVEPGSSGGPLLNKKGELVGINSSYFSQGILGASSIAVPLDNILDFIVPEPKK